MGKRERRDAEGLPKAPKRQKTVHEAPSHEEVQSARHLGELLAFEQDMKKARHGLQSFKLFLDALKAGDKKDDSMQLLRLFLETAKPRDASGDGPFLADIMDAWSYAADVRDHTVVSSAVVVLDLLLQVISRSLDLLPFGTALCGTLLQERQQKLLARNLSSEKNRGFIISPTLRLLREVVGLDGGAFARRVFRARGSTMASLARNLEVRHVGGGEPERRQKASVRTNAVLFLLECLKFLPAESRREMLAERHVVSHLTSMMESDPPYLARELLVGLRQLLEDDKMAREVKFKVFNTKTLTRFLPMYQYSLADEDDEGGDRSAAAAAAAVPDLVHELLKGACTSPSGGVLYPSRGLYPKDVAGQMDDGSRPAGGLDDVVGNWSIRYKDDFPVVNFALSEFALKLRPWANVRHCELLLAIFGAAPELVSNYFIGNKSFAFDPKPSMTWVGCTNFLVGVVQLPFPPCFGARSQWHTPPPIPTVLDHILPRPVSQKALSRCLTSENGLVSFLASRLLVLALGKLGDALDVFSDGEEEFARDGLWAEARGVLLDEFRQRIPEMKEVVQSYRVIPDDHLLHRHAASRLIRSYYETVPQTALVMKLDVAPFAAKSLLKVQGQDLDDESRLLARLELENLIFAASYSPGVRWFSRTGGLPLSLFTSLLRLAVQGSGPGEGFDKLAEVLEAVAVESQIVHGETKLSALLEAHRGLRSAKVPSEETLWQFLDSCISRCAASPIRYLEAMEGYVSELSPEYRMERQGGVPTPSLLLAAMAEQAGHAASTLGEEELPVVATFMMGYVAASASRGEDGSVLDVISRKMMDTLPAAAVAGKLEVPDEMMGDRGQEEGSAGSVPPDGDEGQWEPDGDADADADEDANEALGSTPLSAGDTAALTRWNTQAEDELVEEGHAGRLMTLLLSEHVHIRKEALTNLGKMAAKIRQSSYGEREQVWLLISELVESSRDRVGRGGVPTFLVAFALHGLDVVRNPLHCLYPKMNTFLTRGPAWEPDRVPFALEILQGQPSEDDRYYVEVGWLLSYLLDGLATAADLEAYHRARLFERLMAMASNPWLKAGLRGRMLKILGRATAIEGGSDTLATRFGVFSWLGSQRALWGRGSEEARVLEVLGRRVWETCDQARISRWSRGGVESLVAGLEARLGRGLRVS